MLSRRDLLKAGGSVAAVAVLPGLATSATASARVPASQTVLPWVGTVLAGMAPANTQYTYPNAAGYGIDPEFAQPSPTAPGKWFTDCSGWVSWVLSVLAPDAYAPVFAQRRSGQPVPQADIYWNYFAGVGAGNALWTTVPTLAGAEPGDILCWNLPPSSGDTGHIMIVTAAPTPTATPPQAGVATASWFAVPVCDSSSITHFDETGPRAAPTMGVGRGIINMGADGNGIGQQFQFGPGDSINSDTIRIARLTAAACCTPHGVL